MEYQLLGLTTIGLVLVRVREFDFRVCELGILGDIIEGSRERDDGCGTTHIRCDEQRVREDQ